MDKNIQLQIDNAEIAAKLKGSLLLFIQTLFPILTGRDFILSRPTGRESHFITVCRALTKCTRLESNKLVINIPPGHGKPVHHLTLLHKKNNTRVPIKDIEIGDEVLTHKGRFRRVNKIYHQGELPVLKIKTFSGREVIAALDHPFLTVKGWKNAEDLLLNDVLATVVPQEDYGVALSDEEARLMGYFIGDGCVANGASSITAVDDIEIRDIKHCCRILGLENNVKVYNLKNRPSHYNQNLSRINIRGAKKWLQDTGILGKNSYSKRVPEKIMHGDKRSAINFLAAYFACDGTYGKKAHERRDFTVSITSVSRELLEDCQHLFLRLGIKTRIRKKVRNQKTLKQGDTYTSYNLEFTSQDDIYQFQRVVSPYIFHSKADLLKAHNFDKLRFDSTLLPDAISSIEDAGKEPCMCIEVEEDHTFTANDIVVHNSVMVSFWIAWCLAKYPDSNFLYISYSKTLAASHTDIIKRIMSLSQYRNIFGVRLREDSQAKDAFTTEAGGTVAAFGSAGAITGRNSGLPGLDRFSGATVCFPYDEHVQTENGLIKIGTIVQNKLDIKVYSVDLKTGDVQLKPIIGYYTNPGSEIIEIEFNDGATIRCTPEHKIWTDSRGWVEAKDLLVTDELPSPTANSSPVNSQHSSYIAMRQRLIFQNIQSCIVKIFKDKGSSVWAYARSKIRPSASTPNLIDATNGNAKVFSNILNSISCNPSFADINHFKSIKFSSWSIFPTRKSSSINSILHIFRFAAIANVISMVISAIAVNMSYLHSITLFANKCPRNKFVDMDINHVAVFTQRNAVVSFADFMNRSFKNLFRNFIFPRIRRAYSAARYNNGLFSFYPAKTRNAIDSLIPRNRSPLFIRHIGHVNKSYCINVKDNHNFFAGMCKQVLVSNCDDMHKPDEVQSDLIRESVINNYRETIQQRPRGVNVPTIFIGQRLHEQDLPAYFLSGDDGYDWDRVILRSLDDAGNALYPEAFPLDMLHIRRDKDRYVFAAQHQQDPQPAGGGLFMVEDFPLLDKEPEYYITFITADTAETEDPRNDATAFSFWGMYNIETEGRKTGVMGLHWIDCREIRVEPKHLEGEFLDFWQNCAKNKNPPLLAYIEKKSTGVTLISILNNMRGLKVREIDRTRKSGSKSQRFIDIQPYIAAKQVSLPTNGSHTELCLNHMKKITNNDSHAHDDLADTCSDAVRIALIDQTFSIYTNRDKNARQAALLALARHSNIIELKRIAYKFRD